MTELATVVRVNGQSPELWRADPTHVYVGRQLFLRSGKYARETWPNSSWGNPIKLPAHPTIEDRRQVIRDYENYLARRSLLLRQLHTLAGKKLGCWCGNWDGLSEPRLLCHAAVLADWVNRMQRGEKPWEFSGQR